MPLCPRESKKLRLPSRAMLAALLTLAFMPAFAPGASAQTMKDLQEMTGTTSSRGELSAPPPPSHGKTYKGFLIRQSALNQGSMTMYLCPQRWVLKTAFVTIIVDEEKGKIIAYTRQTNKYLLDTLKVGQERFNGFRRGGDFNWKPFRIVGQEKFQDMPVVVLERKGTRSDLKTKTDVVITERQVSAKTIKVSKTLEQIGFALFDTDYYHGLPIKVSRMASSRNPHYCTLRPVVTLETTLFKESSFPAREFEVPGGLTRVKSEVDLFSNDTGELSSESSTMARLKFREGQINVVPPKLSH